MLPVRPGFGRSLSIGYWSMVTKWSAPTSSLRAHRNIDHLHSAINMPGLVKRLKAPIFQVSTPEVYGDLSVHPKAESDLGNMNLTGCAVATKKAISVEPLVFDYYRSHKLNIRIAQILNTYRSRVHPNDDWLVSGISRRMTVNLRPLFT